MHAPRLGLAAVLRALAVITLVAACSSAAGTASPGATAGSTPPATGATSQAPGASIDVSGAAAGLSNLSSYKVSAEAAGANVEVIVVKGPPRARQIVEVGGSTSIRIVQIGDDVWFDSGSGTFVKNVLPASSVDEMIKGFDPGVIMATLVARAPEINTIAPVGVESKNGVQAQHIHADSSTPLPPGASPIPAGAVFDLWVAVDGGYLVALEATGMSSTASDIKLEVTNINDPALTVTPPA